MKIIINIPDSFRNSLLEGSLTNDQILDVYRSARNGVILPKGHGDLIDRDKIEYLRAIHDAKFGDISWSDAIKKIKYSAPTIIEAEKAKSEE